MTQTLIERAIDANWPREVAFLESLVRVPSDNPPGDCAAIAETAASGLEALGFTVERHKVPEALVRKNGMVSATNLIVRKSFGSGKGPVVALNAHGDVVPPGDGWSVDPYGAVERDGALYGRGAAVSKSDFATYAFALLALEHAGLKLDGGVELHFTFDEEAGGEIGPKWLIAEGLTQAESRHFSRLLLRDHDRPQRRPPPRGRGARAAGARRDAGLRQRRPRSKRAAARRDLWRAEAA